MCVRVLQTLSFALAEKEGAGVVLANDPDADRLAAAEKEARSASAHPVLQHFSNVGLNNRQQ